VTRNRERDNTAGRQSAAVSERDHPGTVNEQQPWRHGWFKRRGTVPDPIPETVGTVAADLKRC
jgi:hypothetical protein